MKSEKRHLGVSLIALIITIAVLVIIAGAVLFRGGLDRIPWAKGGVHDMDRSVVAESVELYSADKASYPVIKISDITTGTATVATGTAVTLTNAIPAAVTSLYTPSTAAIQFGTDPKWYNITTVGSTTTLTLESAATNGAGQTYKLRYVGRLGYDNAGFTATVDGTDKTKVTIGAGSWPINVVQGVQIYLDDSKWHDVASRYSNSIIYLASTQPYTGATVPAQAIKVRQAPSVEEGSYVYDLTYLPGALKTKIDLDAPNLSTKGDGILQVIDMKALADNNYITKTSDKGFGCYNPTTGIFDFSLLNPAGTNTDKYDQIYVRNSTTGVIYYVEGVKAENGIIKY